MMSIYLVNIIMGLCAYFIGSLTVKHIADKMS